MKTITAEHIELIDAVLVEVEVGLLTASILEKDIHVTDALLAFAGVRIPDTRTAFCGDRSLSKAFHFNCLSEFFFSNSYRPPSHRVSVNQWR